MPRCERRYPPVQEAQGTRAIKALRSRAEFMLRDALTAVSPCVARQRRLDVGRMLQRDRAGCAPDQIGVRRVGAHRRLGVDEDVVGW